MDKVVYLTGGSKGIGLGITKSLIEAGARVAISSRSMLAAQLAIKSLGKPDHLLAIQSDVRNYADEEAAINKVIEKWGKVDVLIANAGVGHFAPIDEMTLDQWNEVIDINLTGVFHSVKAAVPALKESKGYMITIASLAGANFFPKGAAYNASKFGLVGFTQAAMLDLRNYGIKATTIMPGSVTSNFNGHTPGDNDDWKIQPEDLGQIVVDLLRMHPRTLPSKVEVRPSIPGGKK